MSEIVNTKEGSYIASDGTEFSELSSKLKGKYQEENMAVAIEAALMLNKAYPDISKYIKKRTIYQEVFTPMASLSLKLNKLKKELKKHLFREGLRR